MRLKHALLPSEPWLAATPQPRLAEGDVADAPSPARLLHAALEERFAGAVMLDDPAKMSRPLRIAVVIGLALACWSAIGIAVLQII